MFEITLPQLKKITTLASTTRLTHFIVPLNRTFEKFKINTPLRASHFLAQVCHESGEFQFLKELASGEAYDTGQRAKDLGNTPQKDGDGQLYKGRGLIQVTGKYNYRECGKILGYNLVADPQILEHPLYATLSAGWFWNLRNLNTYADKDLAREITKRINGGYNGLSDRLMYLSRAKKVLM